jgi:murein DD-endopeptidase MepM/ murein hydrolase activator NlpD
MSVADTGQAPQGSRRQDLLAVMAVVLLSSVFPVDLFPGALHDVRGIDGQFSGKQGQVLLVKVSSDDQGAEAVGKFMSRTIPFFREPVAGAVGDFVGLVGIDMQDAPGSHELLVEIRDSGGARRLSYNVLVLKERFPLQHLSLPKEMVDLDEETLARVKAEQKQVQAVLETVSRERRWSTEFIEPVHGTISGAFGRMRMINGQPRTPHNGEDIAAESGTVVVAMNDGIARLTVDHFFSGKGVLLDHGLGLYSMYFHLSEILVREGDPIARGQVIGKVGATGRATGPHLHWGVRLNGARVDPYALLQLPLNGTAAAR